MIVESQAIVQGMLIAVLVALIITFARIAALSSVITYELVCKKKPIKKNKGIEDLVNQIFRLAFESFAILVIFGGIMILVPIEGSGLGVIQALSWWLTPIIYVPLLGTAVAVRYSRGLPPFKKREAQGV